MQLNFGGSIKLCATISHKVTSIIVRGTSKFNANLTFVYDTNFGGFVTFLRKENMCRMYNGASRHQILTKIRLMF